MDQKQLVLNRLRLAPLTAFDALMDLGVARLASRINELRNDGYEIDTQMIDVPTRRGNARIAQYVLIEEEEKIAW